MTTTASRVSVMIPRAAVSASKQARKGLRCWAKRLTRVTTTGRHSGTSIAVGGLVSCRPGDLILHYDDASEAALGVVMANRVGKSMIRWIDSTTPSVGWFAALVDTARKMVAMSHAERIRYAARHILAEQRQQPLSDEAAEYWRRVADESPPSSPPHHRQPKEPTP